LDVLQAVVGLLVNRPQLEARLTRQSYGNQRLQRQLEGAPDDGHTSYIYCFVALTPLNMFRALLCPSSAPDDGHNGARNMLSGVNAAKQ
jgi:hypothetical protein